MVATRRSSGKLPAQQTKPGYESASARRAKAPAATAPPPTPVTTTKPRATRSSARKAAAETPIATTEKNFVVDLSTSVSATTSTFNTPPADPITPETSLSDDSPEPEPKPTTRRSVRNKGKGRGLSDSEGEGEVSVKRARTEKLKTEELVAAVQAAVEETEEEVVIRSTRSKGKGKAPVEEVDEIEDDTDDVSVAVSRVAKGKGRAKAETPEKSEVDLSDVPITATRSAKGKGKANAEPEPEYEESESELSDIAVMVSRSRKGKEVASSSRRRGKAVSYVEDEQDESEESEYQESESELSEAEEVSEAEEQIVAEASEAGPIDTAIAQAAVSGAERRERRRRSWRESREEKERRLLKHHHPELHDIWTDLQSVEKRKPEQALQPAGLKLELLPFQKEGLNWLRKQEQSIYKGGILADEMGMGKTIQTLALIMSDPDAKPNLVVAPTVALMQWKSEIEKYCGDALSVYIYHGGARTDDAKVLQKHNVVLTTYSVLESVYRKQEKGFKRKEGLYKEKSALHAVDYHRVILDEAHCIKDRTCNTAKAVYILKTKYKLCLSGTPLQNRIGELFSLLRFLEIDPFAYYYCRRCPCKSLHWKFTDNRHCDICKHTPMSHTNYFNNTLLKPIQREGSEGAGAEAFSRIQTLLSHIMLRRTKREREEDLGLPPKVIRIRRDRFTEEELDLYDSIYSDGKRKFETYVAQGVVLNNYANIFTLITRMRQMADHPDLVLRRNAEEGQNNLVCFICDEEAEDAISSKCHHTFCRSCINDYIAGYFGSGSPECPKCHVPLSIDLTQPALEVDTLANKKNSIVSRIDMTSWRSSTKIEALCEELYRLRSRSSTTKSIVFSQFTSMLQLIEWRLKRAGFKTVMLEGSMLPSQREAVINHFMNNVDVEVFLVSLKAGGVALNLIEANCVFIMDPWWNPAASWQAEDRIHRIGQGRVCRVVRMVIEDSIESRIVELQEKKKMMIDATVNADQKAMERLSPADMQFLFQN